MFYDEFLALCKRKNVAPSRAATEMGMNRFIITFRKGGSTPQLSTLQKISNYFDIPITQLTEGWDTQTKTPDLTERDRRDVARDVDRIMGSLESSEELMFDGVPMCEEARAAMASAMRIGLEEARRRNKADYTPKKYRNQKG